MTQRDERNGGTDWNTIFWVGALILFILVITGMASYAAVRGPACLRDYVLVEPAVAAASLGFHLNNEGLIDERGDSTVNYYWVQTSRGLRFYIEGVASTYIGEMCVTAYGESIQWRNVEVIPNENG
jgi:hypothetical protein